jgi:ribosomal protein L40E
MGFFSDLGRKTSETTGKIARETKLKMKINENKGKITDIYEEIGKKVYEKHVREENIDIKADLEEECKKLDELSKEIEEARIEILKLNQKKLCSKCSAEIENGALFCPKCGEKQEQEPTKKEEALEKLEEANIEPEKQEEAEAVKEDLKEEVKEEKSEE